MQVTCPDYADLCVELEPGLFLTHHTDTGNWWIEGLDDSVRVAELADLFGIDLSLISFRLKRIRRGLARPQGLFAPRDDRYNRPPTTIPKGGWKIDTGWLAPTMKSRPLPGAETLHLLRVIGTVI